MAPMHFANDDTEDIPVLVVVAGPAGLAATIELARREIPTLLIERRRALSSHPRATVLSLRSMELMRMWGLEAEVRARSVDVEFRMLLTDTLAEAGGGSAIEVGYPSREQSRVLSPTTPACIGQDEVEPLLLAHLSGHPAARVEFGVELTGIAERPGGARATLRDVRTGAMRTVHARYVVAGDGARSAVRGALGIRLIGAEAVLVGATTLFRAPLWDLLREHRYLLYSAAASGTFLPAGPGDRWLWAAAQGESAAPPDERRAAALIRLGVGAPGLPLKIEGFRRFSSAAQLAVRFRCGPVFLAGDAAHRVTPRGGTGLNLALHDGYDLGWKLAWALHDWAGPELLDTYEAERRPVAEHGVARSADPAGSRRAPEQELHADLGGRIAHAWTGERSTLDLLGPRLTLFTAPDGTDRAAPPTRAPIHVRRLDPLAAAAVGAARHSAVLVRPDGKPVGALTADDDPPPALRVAVAAVAA